MKPTAIKSASRNSMSRSEVSQRPASQVMRLSRLGAFHQSRLSFMRVLTRRLARESWKFERTLFDIDKTGTGRAVYTFEGPQRAYSLVVFSHLLPFEEHSDRVIAEAWDTTFTLFDGIPSKEDLERLAENVPGQEAGRISGSELSLSRANRSLRLWDHVVEALAAGDQPNVDQLMSVGYLMRTTAVYGSGKFGAADRQAIASRVEFKEPFQVEMLNVYLIRCFVQDLVEHMARVKGGSQAVVMSRNIAQRLGIGNSTGLGMAPFIVNHPILFNNWISAREEGLRRVRNRSHATDSELDLFTELLARARHSFETWHTDHTDQFTRVRELHDDLNRLSQQAHSLDSHTERPWDQLYRWSEEHLALEAQECLVSLMMEPYPDLIDELSSSMSSTRSRVPPIDGSATVARTSSDIARVYEWAKSIDWNEQGACARAWYVSEEKLEPRLGERFQESVEDYEQPLAPARDAIALHKTLESWPDNATMAEVLLAHPEHRHTVRRLQIVTKVDYAEIRDNTIDADMQPIDMLRCKLSFFGATHFDPRSDRWLRICLYAGAPFPDELTTETADRWVYPILNTHAP